MTVALGPRVVIAGTASGVGKTTVATGILAALARRGTPVAGAKVGPDYIDPGYHALACGRPGRNLDAWLCGPAAMGPLAGRAGAGARVLVVEGVMGCFDGALDPVGPGELPRASTAEAAHLLGAPVVLVVDASSCGASVAAVVSGFARFDARVPIGGVILNRVGSDAHEAILREALEPVDVPVLGVLRRDDRLTWRDRHLGLVPVAESPGPVRAALDRLADAVSAGVDLDAVVALAQRAPRVRVGEPRLPDPVGRAVVAVAAGPAFSFTYRDNLEALAAAGAELVEFDPCRDEALPAGASALIAGGGFPEAHGEALAANEALLGDLRARVEEGLVVWAECGGLLWLARSLDGRRLAGALAADAAMGPRLHLGYRRARTRVVTPLGPPGTELRGHEFHYSTLDPAGDAMEMSSRFTSHRAGHATSSMLASYLHVHLGAAPSLAEAFVRSAATARCHPTYPT